MQSAVKAPLATRSLPFQIRGGMQTILSLRLLAPEDPNLFPLLVDKIAHSPDFFRQAPIVLDLGALADRPPIDLALFADRLRDHHLVPVGVQNGAPAWVAAASAAGLAIFGAGGQAEAPATRPPRAAAKEVAPSPPPRGAALVIDQPVRGGQQIHNPDGDLVVTAMVGHGAELAAAGHIHVYGVLRGRAFAGIGGDERAMIFCDQLEAQLISIAGVHLVNEELEPSLIGRRVRVHLEHERLVLRAPG